MKPSGGNPRQGAEMLQKLIELAGRLQREVPDSLGDGWLCRRASRMAISVGQVFRSKVGQAIPAAKPFADGVVGQYKTEIRAAAKPGADRKTRSRSLPPSPLMTLAARFM